MTQAKRTRDARPPGGSETFLVLRENRLAFAAIERLLQPSSRGGAPLAYLWGPSGTGKSHLARHLMREFRRANPSAKAEQLTASEFAAQLAESSHRENVRAFQDKFRELDLLVCEDLQGLSGRPESQRQLVAVIDALRQRGSRVLITSDRLPHDVAGLQTRLVSRCHAGATVPIGLPGLASRVSLLTQFASARQIAISPEAVRELAERRPASPRELLGLLTQLETAARASRSPLDQNLVKRSLADDVPDRVPSLSDIARAVARQYGVRVSELRSAARQKGLTLPRQCAMSLSRQLTEEPLLRIAEFFGRRNHSAVIQACRRTEEKLTDDPALRQHLKQIRSALGSRPFTEDSP